MFYVAYVQNTNGVIFDEFFKNLDIFYKMEKRKFAANETCSITKILNV